MKKRALCGIRRAAATLISALLERLYPAPTTADHALMIDLLRSADKDSAEDDECLNSQDIERIASGLLPLLLRFGLWRGCAEKQVRSLLVAGAWFRDRVVRVVFESPAEWPGDWDGVDMIRIAPNRPWREQSAVLIHELLHAADDLTSSDGTRLPHDAITRISEPLLLAFAQRGRWPVSVEDAREAFQAL